MRMLKQSHTLAIVLAVTVHIGCGQGETESALLDVGPDGTDVASDAGLLPDGEDALAVEEVTLPELLENPPTMLGGDRPATYFVPGGYTPEEPLPALVLLHGYSASAAMQDLYFALSDTTLEMGVFLITPNGTTNAEGLHFWNAVDACCDSYGSKVDDVSYILSLVDEASAYFAIDPKRVYLAGHSNGGFMSQRIACEASERIAGIMSLAGTTWEDPADCGDPQPVAMLHVHGTQDTVIWYDGVVGTQGTPQIDLGDPSACLDAQCSPEHLACSESTGCAQAFDCSLACPHHTCITACLGQIEEDDQALFANLVQCGMDESCLDTSAVGISGYASAQETGARWAKINGCSMELTAGEAMDLEVTIGGAETLVERYDGCPQGAGVEVWSMDGVGHIPIFGPDWAPTFVGWLLEQSRP